jgi:hypothetical protein
VFSKVDPTDSSRVQFLTLPARNGSAGSLSVLYPDETTATAMLDLLRGGSATQEPSATTTQPTIDSGAGSATTTSSPALPITDEDRFGPPAELTAPCA